MLFARVNTEYFMANSDVKEEKLQWGGLSTGRNFGESQEPGRAVKAAQNSTGTKTQGLKS